jgi:hypothetical protein
MANEEYFPGDSVELMAAGVHDPVFFQKLASDWRIAPRNESERDQFLELALMLREQRDLETVKSASHSSPFLAGAVDSLKTALNQSGYATEPTSDVASIKSAAAQLASRPDFQKAALDYGAYLASVAGN